MKTGLSRHCESKIFGSQSFHWPTPVAIEDVLEARSDKMIDKGVVESTLLKNLSFCSDLASAVLPQSTIQLPPTQATSGFHLSGRNHRSLNSPDEEGLRGMD